jgi:formylglycine-generating enzyme required for sulfatase activity
MSNLFQRLGKTRPGPAAESAAPRLTLAAFGKHPGWDDHMPGIGVDTETLAYIKQALYVTGIGRQIDSGSWEKLEADKRQEGFDHTFLWLRAAHLVLGQLWSSKDGKGRAKYPMVLCVDGEGVSPSLLLNKVRPGLEALRDACKAATAAEQVASNCRVAQEQLRKLFAGRGPRPDPKHAGDDPRRFLERGELGPDRQGLLRVLHELSGSFDTSGDTRAPVHGGDAPAPSLHLRVPLAADSQNSAFLLWAGFLRSVLAQDVPLILMARGQADWLDVVVGEPKADDFFFLQASQKGFPLVTQIPYELAPNAMARLREVEVRFRGGEPTAPEAAAKVPAPAPPSAARVPAPAPPSTPKVPTAAPPPTPKAPPPAPAPTAPRAEKPATPSKRKTALIAGSVVVVLIAGLFAWLPHGKTGDQKHFEELLASGKSLLGEKKYDEAIHYFEEADKIHPQDEGLKQIVDQARRERDKAVLPDPYQLAMKNGRGDFSRGDFATALAEAGKALSIKPDDGDAKQLRDGAQARLAVIAAATQKEADYQSAMKNGRGSFTRGDYADALAQAGKALSLKPDDGDAKQLRGDAQAKQGAIAAASQKEAEYQSAMKDGRGSFARGDYTDALAQAGKALSLKPDDGDARQLRGDAQAKQGAIMAASQKEAEYQSAMKDGRESFASGDFAGALAQAGKALSLKPDDVDAKQLRGDAQAKQGVIAQASQKEAEYQSAMKDGRGSFTRGDYTDASAQAGKALSLKPDDGDAKQLRDDAQAKIGEIAAASQKEADYRAAIINGRGSFARGDYTDALAQAGKALSLKADDADAKQLRDDASQKLSGAHARSFTNSIQMEFVWVPGAGVGGAFIGKYEVTEKQYQTIMGGLPNGQALASTNLPVAGVTFPQATQFCEKLSGRENKHYSLPTRPQWLSAAGLSEDKVADAWKTLSASGALEHEATSFNRHPARTKPLPVGSMSAAAGGVCDMLGNVREWVSEQQRAGFSYQSSGAGRTGELFLPGPVPDAPWIEQETGLRCILRESPPP